MTYLYDEVIYCILFMIESYHLYLLTSFISLNFLLTLYIITYHILFFNLLFIHIYTILLINLQKLYTLNNLTCAGIELQTFGKWMKHSHVNHQSMGLFKVTLQISCYLPCNFQFYDNNQLNKLSKIIKIFINSSWNFISIIMKF